MRIEKIFVGFKFLNIELHILYYKYISVFFVMSFYFIFKHNEIKVNNNKIKYHNSLHTG